MKFLSFILITILVSQLSAGIIATTEDGRKVLLQENGTWRFIKDKQISDKKEAKEKASMKKQHHSLVELIQQDSDYDFRKVRWGMSKKEVMSTEDAKLLKNEDTRMEYAISLFGYDCDVTYSFIDSKLSTASLHIRQPHIDPALYYKDYKSLKKYLTPLYGDALSDKCDWKNEMYRGDESKWGFAVSLGFLTCRTLWHNDRTQVTLLISGSNHQIMTNLEYGEWIKR
jgi:hypothetical protein